MLTIERLKECLGQYEDKLEAALAYDKAAKVYHGNFARVNFPETPK